MCNATNTITTKVNELMELRKMADELNAEMETLIDAIKAYISKDKRLPQMMMLLQQPFSCSDQFTIRDSQSSTRNA